jgi:hypothetical protein
LSSKMQSIIEALKTNMDGHLYESKFICFWC